MIVSCNGANFVAQQIGYHMGTWSDGDGASNAYYSPAETFASRFEAFLLSVRKMGFDRVDIWTGELNWKWATDEQLATAASLLAKHGLTVTSYAGGFGATEEEVTRACKTIKALGCNMLGGSTELLTRDPAALVRVLERKQVLFAFENHPDEKNPNDVMKVIGDFPEDIVGTVVDTGWFGTHGYDASKAINELAGRLFLVHLKDVLAPGGHETCQYGRGCVPIERCVSVLRDLGYEGAVSVEHEPHNYDPSEEIVASRKMLEGWLK